MLAAWRLRVQHRPGLLRDVSLRIGQVNYVCPSHSIAAEVDLRPSQARVPASALPEMSAQGGAQVRYDQRPATARGCRMVYCTHALFDWSIFSGEGSCYGTATHALAAIHRAWKVPVFLLARRRGAYPVAAAMARVRGERGAVCSGTSPGGASPW
jgi:hypothetical protein